MCIGKEVCLALAVVPVVSCVATHIPQPTNSSGNTPVDTSVGAPLPPAAGQWSIHYQEQSIAYHVTRNAVIQTTDSTRQEKSENTAHEKVTLTSVAADSTRFQLSGTVDTFTTNAGRLGSTPPIQLPITVGGSLTASGLAITPGDTTCDPVTSAFATDLQSVFPRLPLTLSSGLQWQDSTETQGCQGGVTTTSKAVRSFSVAGEVTFRGQRVIQINATEAITAEGQGVRQQHQIGLRASGTGHETYFIDASAGRVVHLQRRQILNIFITAEGKETPFMQTVEQEFDLVL
jgi:hypothetical protein